ncbi:uncharacterized protein LOC135682904 isoform X2 [Rhopilema esculentum]|uniref:uncharacterized protein LOC135682904 isoform X2 n=1 Tax=Rhopilema esculentum TaxID=499914 RepID=UPI0031CF5615
MGKSKLTIMRIFLLIITVLPLNSSSMEESKFGAVFEEIHNPQRKMTSMIDKSFHKCSIDAACNYVAKNIQTNRFDRYKLNQDIGNERTNLIIWAKQERYKTSTVNIALKKPSFQSSKWESTNFFFARFANDGIAETYSCTTAEINPWWQVVLGRRAAVKTVRVLPMHPPVGLGVTVGDQYLNNGLGNKQCHLEADSDFHVFRCSGAIGRYVTVFAKTMSKEYLAINEVEVYEDLSIY